MASKQQVRARPQVESLEGRQLLDAGISFVHGVVDIRGKVLPPGSHPRYLAKRADYEAGHVPGAVFVDWTRDIVDIADPVPAQIARASPALTLDLESRLRASAPLPARKADRVHTINLTGQMNGYVWSINGVPWNKNVPPLPVAKGERSSW